MSEENVERLRTGFDYTARTGEIDRATVHPDFVWDMSTYRGAIDPGTYEGVDQANAFLARWIEAFEDWSMEIEELLDFGDQVVAVVRQYGKGKHGGPDVEMRFAQVWTFRPDGLIARADMYADRNEALEAAGLSE
jgi:ketosteroid isomerase-like protein